MTKTRKYNHTDSQRRQPPACAFLNAYQKPARFVAAMTISALASWSMPALAHDETEGKKNWLKGTGINLSLTYNAEVLTNLTGGQQRTAIYSGVLTPVIELDLERLGLWTGALFHVEAYQIHGRRLGADALGENVFVPSGFETRPTTRLGSLWLQQTLWDGLVSLRIGQLSAEEDFQTTEIGELLVNSTFTWPGWADRNLPGSGPAHFLPQPGIRLKVQPTEKFSVIAGLFGGNPAGNSGDRDPEEVNISGTTFSLSGGVFLIAEAQYVIEPGPEEGQADGIIKFGALYHSGTFNDVRRDTNRLSLASLDSSGIPQRQRGNYGFYAIVEQQLTRPNPLTEEGIRGFARFAVMPGNINAIDFYVDSGLSWTGVLPSRPEDSLIFGFAIGRFSPSATGFDRDKILLAGPINLARDFEAVVELGWLSHVTPWLSIQPVFQYIFHPTGETVSEDAAVLGVRSVLSF